MRLRSHIAAQTGLLVGTGLLLVTFVNSAIIGAFDARERVREDALHQQELTQLSEGLGHLLLVGDLVLSGGTSYLGSVAGATTEQLVDQIDSLRRSSLLEGERDELFAISVDVQKLGDAVTDSLELDGSDRESHLNELFLEFDQGSVKTRERLEALQARTDVLVKLRQEEAEVTVANARARGMLGAAVLLLAMLLAWRHLTWFVVAPIQKLTTRALQAEAGGDYRAEMVGPAEVRSLSATIGSFAQGLRAANDELEGKVRERTAELEKALEARSMFLANTSHELRTPLNAILGFTEILTRETEEGSPTEEERREYLELIGSSGQHLLALIENVLDLSRIDADEDHIDTAPVDPRRVLGEVDAILGDSAAMAGLRLSFAVDDAVPALVETDKVRLRQILINLVGNAVKFTERGLVHVRAEWRDDLLTIQVKDSGIGISPEMIERVFAPFEQVDGSDSRRVGGSGLGLAISRRLARMLGGDLQAESTPGEGSTFTLTLASPVAEFVDDEAAKDLYDEVPPAGARILLVDDVPTNRLVGRRLLERWELNVTEAHDGAQAVDAFRDAVVKGMPFDAVLMDLQMPEVDGYEATARLRAEGFTGPILAVSAAVMRKQRERAIEVGCDGFVSKPLVVDELRAALAHHLRRELKRTG